MAISVMNAGHAGSNPSQLMRKYDELLRRTQEQIELAREMIQKARQMSAGAVAMREQRNPLVVR